nr:hypothetical protein [Tanacetum cinerariifolium]
MFMFLQAVIDSLLDEFAGELILLKSIPPEIDEADCDTEEEIHLIEKLLYDNSSSCPPEEFIFENSNAVIESFSPSPIPVEDNDDSSILTVKVVGDISEHDVPMPILLPTQPTLASNQEKSPHLLSHRGLKAFQLSFENPMMIYGENIPILDVSFLHFYPP